MGELQNRPNLDMERRAYYAAHVPDTLAECIVRASENAQSNKDELSLLRGMLTNFLDKLVKGPNAEEAAYIVTLVREIRATLKAESELSAREKGLLHPAAFGIFTQLVIQIVRNAVPDESTREAIENEVGTRIAEISVDKLDKGV